VFGEPLVYLATVGSTNDVAARLADAGAAEGATVVADEQTTGRGRLGRSWFSAEGAGLYVSVVIRPDGAIPDPGGDFRELGSDPNLQKLPSGSALPALPTLSAPPAPPALPALPAMLTLAAGVALAEAVQEATGLQPDIKWPNDLMCGRRKLAGILAEASAKGADLDYVVVGFGINIRAAAYPPEVADRATCLEAELGRPVDRGLVLGLTLARLAVAREALRRNDAAAILEQWRRMSPSAVGRPVSWQSAGGLRRGTTAGLDADGALLVDVQGRRERVIAGEVTWL
jgi:BirA family biotin operon repressor/biotin-[acetyl-CoA-carboxylase] ligase